MAGKVGPSGEVKKVVLAYSGGLDTSIILKWLQDTYGVRSRSVHRGFRPRRRTRSGESEGVENGRQGRKYLHRRRSRGVRERVRLSDVFEPIRFTKGRTYWARP